jgi:hypothetical protein
VAVDSNSRQRIPELFMEIMRIDDELEKALAYRSIAGNGGLSFEYYSKLVKRKAELRKAAEIALQWNHNKGSTK